MPAVEQLDFKGAILQNKTLLFNNLKQKLHEIISINVRNNKITLSRYNQKRI